MRVLCSECGPLIRVDRREALVSLGRLSPGGALRSTAVALHLGADAARREYRARRGVWRNPIRADCRPIRPHRSLRLGWGSPASSRKLTQWGGRRAADKMTSQDGQQFRCHERRSPTRYPVESKVGLRKPMGPNAPELAGRQSTRFCTPQDQSATWWAFRRSRAQRRRNYPPRLNRGSRRASPPRSSLSGSCALPRCASTPPSMRSIRPARSCGASAARIPPRSWR